MQLTVDKLEKSFGVHEIFKDVSFMIARGEKIGLVGVNGSGKSTLVKCLLQPEYADRGTVSFEPGINVGYVEQGFGSIGSESVWDFMLKANPEILSLRRKLAELEQASATGDREVLDSYGRATQRYEFLDGYNYEAKLKMVLFGLAFPESMWGMQAASLSGGQKTRLLLAAALVSSPDFLLLDEPTNHLDIRMMEWLEGYLRDFKGGVLVVSHDRAFLDHVATGSEGHPDANGKSCLRGPAGLYCGTGSLYTPFQSRDQEQDGARAAVAAGQAGTPGSSCGE